MKYQILFLFFVSIVLFIQKVRASNALPADTIQTIILKGTVIDGYNDPIKDIQVVLNNWTDHIKISCHTDYFGKYAFYLQPNKKYSLRTLKKCYSDRMDTFNTNGVNTCCVKVNNLKRFKTTDCGGMRRDVHFKKDSIFLNNVNKKLLDELYQVLIEYPNIGVEIDSHTDNRGDAKANKKLSLKNGKIVANYLIEKGIDKSRIHVVAYGEKYPDNACSDSNPCSEEEYNLNNRIEFKVFGEANNTQIIYQENVTH